MRGCVCGCVCVCVNFKEFGADPTLKNARGRTAIDVASTKQIAKLLKKEKKTAKERKIRAKQKIRQPSMPTIAIL